MEQTLFDFFQAEKGPASAEELSLWTEQISRYYLKRGNPYWYLKSEVVSEGFSYRSLNELIKVGVLDTMQSREEVRLSLKESYRQYESAEKVAGDLEEAVEKALYEGKRLYEVSWIFSHFYMSGQYNPKEAETYKRLSGEINKNVAIQLGLEHFINVPDSRGSKINLLSSPFEKNVTFPKIAEDVIPMTEFDEVKAYFKNNIFFCGKKDRNDWPFPSLKELILNDFLIACLAEAKDQKTVKLILSHAGGTSPSIYVSRKNVIFPDGWSLERFNSELSADEIAEVLNSLQAI